MPSTVQGMIGMSVPFFTFVWLVESLPVPVVLLACWLLSEMPHFCIKSVSAGLSQLFQRWFVAEGAELTEAGIERLAERIDGLVVHFGSGKQ